MAPVIGVGLAALIVSLVAGFALSRSAELPSADTVPPTLRMAPPEPVSSYRAPVVVRGTAVDAVRVSIGPDSVVPAADGTFELSVRWAPAFEVVAVDAQGNQASSTLVTQSALPRMRAVHVTAHAWSHEGLREAVLDLAREGRIDTVQLDIKDEDGVVGYASQVPLAVESGATAAIYDAPAALRQLHDRACRWSAASSRSATRLSRAGPGTTDGPTGLSRIRPATLSSHYGPVAFTNFADPEVRQYNIALAVEAAQLGFDGIMYDYVRRPDGSLTSMNFAGLATTPATAVAGFPAESRYPVHLAGAHLSAVVYGSLHPPTRSPRTSR